MLAEIFLLKLEAIARTTTPSGTGRQVSDPRFVPVAVQPPVKK